MKQVLLIAFVVLVLVLPFLFLPEPSYRITLGDGTKCVAKGKDVICERDK